MYDNEFGLDPSDFDDDGLSEVDEKKLEVIKQIKEYAQLAEENIKYQEDQDYELNFKILARYIQAMNELNMLSQEEEKLDDEELKARIDEIMRSVKEISCKDLRPVEMDDEEGKRLSLDDLDKKDDDQEDGSTDW